MKVGETHIIKNIHEGNINVDCKPLIKDTTMEIKVTTQNLQELTNLEKNKYIEIVEEEKEDGSKEESKEEGSQEES